MCALGGINLRITASTYSSLKDVPAGLYWGSESVPYKPSGANDFFILKVEGSGITRTATYIEVPGTGVGKRYMNIMYSGNGEYRGWGEI